MPVRYGEVVEVSLNSSKATVSLKRPDADSAATFDLYDASGSGALTQAELLYRSAAIGVLTRAAADHLIVRVFLDDKNADHIVQLDLVREMGADDDTSTDALLAPIVNAKFEKGLNLHLKPGPP